MREKVLKVTLTALLACLIVFANSACQPQELFLLDAPTTPVRLNPPDGTVYQHFPRTTTLSWAPGGGGEPEKYTLEVQVGYDGSDNWGDPETYTVTETSYTFRWVGANPGRWRVNAVNSAGASTWSRWHHFEYTR